MRDHARYLQVAYGSSERRSCELLTFESSTCRYESLAAEQAALRMRIRNLAASRVSYGYRRIHVLLQRGRLTGESQEDVQASQVGGTADAAYETQAARVRSEEGDQDCSVES